MEGNIVTVLLSDNIVPAGGASAVCGCGRVQERSGAAGCDQCYPLRVQRAPEQWCDICEAWYTVGADGWPDCYCG